MIYTLSSHTLHLYEDCPRCFWLQMNEDIKRPEGIFPSLPSGMDKILKEYYDHYRKQQQLPPELEVLTGVQLFQDEERLKLWRSNRKGLRYTNEEGHTLQGAIDNLLQKGDKLIVLDYKTRGYPLKSDTADHYQNQMDIYNLLLRKNGYSTEDFAYLTFYYPKEANMDGTIKFNVDLVKINIDPYRAESLFNAALESLQKPLPESGENCNYCRWHERLRN